MTHPAVAQLDRTTLDFAVGGGDDEIGLCASVAFLCALALALTDGLDGADDGRAGCYGGDDAQNHIWEWLRCESTKWRCDSDMEYFTTTFAEVVTEVI